MSTIKKEIAIPVRLTTNGCFELLAEGVTIPEGVEAELRIDLKHFELQEKRSIGKKLVIILPAETVLFMPMRINKPAKSMDADVLQEHEIGRMTKGTIKIVTWSSRITHVFTVVLTQDLKLILSNAKAGRLAPCQCHIPVLDEKAISVNHAYTRLSEEFESHRLSHTANIFTTAGFLKDGVIRPLRELRSQHQPIQKVK